MTQLGDKGFRLALEDCLAFGKPMLIENIEEELDPVLDPVLERRLVGCRGLFRSMIMGNIAGVKFQSVTICSDSAAAHPNQHTHSTAVQNRPNPPKPHLQVRKGKSWVIQLADKEVDFTDTFKLFCTTRLPNPHFTPELCAKVTVVDFTVTMAGGFVRGGGVSASFVEVYTNRGADGRLIVVE